MKKDEIQELAEKQREAKTAEMEKHWKPIRTLSVKEQAKRKAKNKAQRKARRANRK